jgi:excisionase family DNA binding protein
MTPYEIYELAKALAPLVAEMVLARLGSVNVENDDYVDSHQAAELMKCSLSSVERLVRKGVLPSHKIGHLRRFRRSDLLAFNMEAQS